MEATDFVQKISVYFLIKKKKSLIGKKGLKLLD